MTPDAAATRSIGDAVRGSALEALDASLARAAVHPTVSIEERGESLRLVRRASKRVRAILPFARPALRVEIADGTERLLTDASALLSPMRDRDAVVATVDRLFGDRRDATGDAARTALTAIVAPEERADHSAFERMAVARAAALLAEARDQVADWPVDAIGAAEVAEAMAQSWRVVRRETRGRWDEGDLETVHDVRKRCSRLAVQCGLLEPFRRKPFRGLRRVLRSVNGTLGDDRDLAMLAERLALRGPAARGQAFTDEALAVVARTRSRLRARAAEEIQSALAIKPGALARAVRRAFELSKVRT